VAWGYAHAADRLGVDIIENCDVTGFIKEGERVVGVETKPRRYPGAEGWGGGGRHDIEVMRKAGVEKLPIESHILQAFVTEPLKPLIHCVVTFGAGHMYVSQSDKGGLVFGGNLDYYNSYAQRGYARSARGCDRDACCLPQCRKVRLLRSWGGVMDMSMDGSPIITTGPLPGLFLNCGWCYGGFKATPGSGWCFAHTIAHDEPHPLNAPFTLERFHQGRPIDEKGAGPTPRLH
jgi:sarcosine oxidase subunit beta